MDAEIEKLRNTFNKTMSQCQQPKNTTKTEAVEHFCNYHNTREFQMIDEVRDFQRKKSLEIHSKSSKTEGVQR